MTFHGALLPAGLGRGQDRWSATDNIAVVLDGASSFTPSVADAGAYVDMLLSSLMVNVSINGIDLREALSKSILQCARGLAVPPIGGPSSTVLIARQGAETFEILVLGDSTAIVGTVDGSEVRLTDDRLGAIGTEIRERYRHRLRGGAGYDYVHAEMLRELQEVEKSRRNKPSGYWIAEADPYAAVHAIVHSFRLEQASWCVLATDGAQRGMDHLGIAWAEVAEMSSGELGDLLARLHDWEERADPSGVRLPRSKRHDDKTVVVWRPGR
ncbi:hypothetical protein ACFOWZ_11495 [Lentzea rhizosphaerae]|uniref:PPM-type phosphatase domain-containing protein n=1 Tax=Lentzea rhizosphaerae TaxID=2041025 RepID=A0ABV8BQA3_9PSEU